MFNFRVQKKLILAPAFALSLVMSLLVAPSAADPEQSENLLANASFESRTDDWVTCSGRKLKLKKGDSTDGQRAGVLKRGDCITQDVQIGPDAISWQVGCGLKPIRKGAKIAVVLTDAAGEVVSETDYSGVTERRWVNYGFSELTIPKGAVQATIIVSTGQKALVDNCKFVTSSFVQDPTNLLFNGDFDLPDTAGNEAPAGWRNLCSGYADRVFNFDYTLYLGDGACVHQYLSDEALETLEGNYFALSCQYTLAEDAYSTIATNLTSLRDETGQNEVKVLPRTSFEEIPGFQFETVTLYGKAKDTLVPGDIFVSVGSQAAVGPIVLDCDLRVVDEADVK